MNLQESSWGYIQLFPLLLRVCVLKAIRHIKATNSHNNMLISFHAPNPNANAFFYNLKMRRDTNNLAMWDKRLFRLLVT